MLLNQQHGHVNPDLKKATTYTSLFYGFSENKTLYVRRFAKFARRLAAVGTRRRPGKNDKRSLEFIALLFDILFKSFVRL